MSVNYYIANPSKKTFIELDKGSWSWLIEFFPHFIYKDSDPEYLNNLAHIIKNSVNLSWKADDETIINYWVNKIRSFLVGENINNLYLVADDVWIKYDRS